MWGRRRCGYGDVEATQPGSTTPDPLTTVIEYYQGNCIDGGSGRKVLREGLYGL